MNKRQRIRELEGNVSLLKYELNKVKKEVWEIDNPPYFDVGEKVRFRSYATPCIDGKKCIIKDVNVVEDEFYSSEEYMYIYSIAIKGRRLCYIYHHQLEKLKHKP